jgi:4-hydroxy-tetrahydrodipicolinate reductase
MAGDIIRVGVVGAAGKMGKVVCAAVIADPELELVAAIDVMNVGTPIEKVIGRGDGGVAIARDLDGLTRAPVQVAVDFTHPDAVMNNVRWYARNRLHAVIGTTGIGPANLDEIRRLTAEHGVNMVVSPDFSPAGVVMLHIAKIAARHLDEVELLEIHPPGKAEAPSGTTMNTARTLAKVRAGRSAPAVRSRELVTGAMGGTVEGIRVHSLRLSGCVGHEEMRFAHRGDTLTISSTSHSREGYTAGVILGIKAVRGRSGLTYGLEPILGFE